MKMFSILFNSSRGSVLSVESEIHQGFPNFEIFFDNSKFAAKKTKTKLRTAIRQQNFSFPKGTVTTLISPPLQCSGTEALDAAVCASILFSSVKTDAKILICGNVNLRGEISAEGIHIPSVIKAAEKNGMSAVIVPKNKENTESDRTEIFCVKNLRELYGAVCESIAEYKTVSFHEEVKRIENPFLGIIGLDNAKKAMITAAAGNHSILLVGPGGCGKTLLLSRLSALLCEPDTETKAEREQNINILHSRGTAYDGNVLILDADNSTIGKFCRSAKNEIPEIIAFHGGYISADEINTFNISSLQTLKIIMSKPHISANGENYPLRISLAAAMNPCPCGRLGLEKSRCSCKKQSIDSHWRNLTNTVLPRFELAVPVTTADFQKDKELDYTAALEKIRRAKEMQKDRYKGINNIRTNNDLIRFGLDFDMIKKANALFPGRDNIREIIILYALARTEADLDESEEIKKEHAERAELLYVKNPSEMF